MVGLGVAAIVELWVGRNRAQYLGTNSVPAAQTVETAAANYRRVQTDLVAARCARQPKLISQSRSSSSRSTIWCYRTGGGCLTAPAFAFPGTWYAEDGPSWGGKLRGYGHGPNGGVHRRSRACTNDCPS